MPPNIKEASAQEMHDKQLVFREGLGTEEVFEKAVPMFTGSTMVVLEAESESGKTGWSRWRKSSMDWLLDVAACHVHQNSAGKMYMN